MHVVLSGEEFKFAVKRACAVFVDREYRHPLLLTKRLLSIADDEHECQEQAQHSPDLPIAHHRASPLFGFGPLGPG